MKLRVQKPFFNRHPLVVSIPLLIGNLNIKRADDFVLFSERYGLRWAAPLHMGSLSMTPITKRQKRTAKRGRLR